MTDPHAEFAAAGEEYQRAITRHELAGTKFADNGYGTEAEWTASAIARAEAAERFDRASKALAERTIAGLLCLVRHDPSALARVWGELGVPSALAGWRDEIDKGFEDLARLRAKIVSYRHAVHDLLHQTAQRIDKLEAEWVDWDLRFKGDDGF